MLTWLKGAALVAFIGLCISTSYTVVSVGKHISNTLMATDDTVVKLNTEIDELHRFTLEAALTASEARKASIKESRYLDTWNTELTKTLVASQNMLKVATTTIASIDSVSAASVSTLRTTQDTMVSLQSPILAATDTINEIGRAVNSIDNQVSNPDIAQIIHSTDQTSASLARTSADIEQEVHSLTHPTWLHKLWGGILDVAHVFNPL